MELNTWWADDPEQRFWMETTKRPDVGADLHAPALHDKGGETPGYSLVREVREGDIVFHYEKDVEAITSWSVAAGGFWEAETLWGTPRSTGPTGQPVEPYPRPGLWHGLQGPYLLPEPLTRLQLMDERDTVVAVHDAVDGAHPGAIYFPIQIRQADLRASQAYLSKMPAEFVHAFPQLAVVLGVPEGAPPEIPPPGVELDDLGREYVPVNENVEQVERDPFPVDPAVVERGIQSHAKLQNALAAHAKAKHYKVVEPNPTDPRWDVLWKDDTTVWVAEVKSLTAKNEVRQLRLGLGQLLHYRHRLAKNGLDVQAVLAVEYEPSDQGWQELCDELGILLVWPEVLAERL